MPRGDGTGPAGMGPMASCSMMPVTSGRTVPSRDHAPLMAFQDKKEKSLTSQSSCDRSRVCTSTYVGIDMFVRHVYSMGDAHTSSSVPISSSRLSATNERLLLRVASAMTLGARGASHAPRPLNKFVASQRQPVSVGTPDDHDCVESHLPLLESAELIAQLTQ